ncbi:MAG: EAL domain-containing protein [Phycisphaerales bacterium]
MTGASEPHAPDRAALERLIASRAVEAIFQPIVGVESATIAGLETLTRPAAGSGFPNADALFDAAERFGLLWELEEVTRARAFTAAAEWDDSVLLFLNCSPQVFADARFADSVMEAVRGVRGLEAARVVLEITERSEQQYTDGLAAQVDRLKQLGFQIAIDDVGAGTSGLNRIMRLRPHWLKLDRDLVRDIDHDRVRQNLIRFLLHFARLSQVRVVAEGIERAEEMAILMDLGVSHAQGYYLARPGARVQRLPEAVVAQLRAGSGSSTSRGPEATTVSIVRLVQPAHVERSTTPVGQVSLCKASTGIVVQDGNRLIGWCPRWRLLSCESPRTPLAALVDPDITYVSPDCSVVDACDLVVARPDADGSPLIVLEGGRVHGVVTLRALVSATLDLLRERPIRRAPLTGLPGRVLADEHLARAIAQYRSGAPSLDAAIIDLQRFFDYNLVYGYDLGDQLLVEVAQVLGGIGGDAFVAHLTDDRFLVTAPAGVISSRLPELARRLDGIVSRYGGTAPMGLDSASVTAMGLALRVVLLPEAIGRASSPREVHAEASRLRADPPKSRWIGSRCLVIESDRVTQRQRSA